MKDDCWPQSSTATSSRFTIHDIGICDGFHFISLEYVEGGELGDKIKEGISPSQAAAYIETLADCLGVAHDLHIVHRDIKPANILFRNDGTLLLTDFGIAKQLTIDKGLTTTGAVIGSPHYLSPEQAQGKTVDGRADIYSLGVLYYEMLTGNRPFTGDSDIAIAIKHVTQPVPKLPDVLAESTGVSDRMTRKDPDERFPSCRSLLVALREIRETGRWSGEIADLPLSAPVNAKSIAIASQPSADGTDDPPPSSGIAESVRHGEPGAQRAVSAALSASPDDMVVHNGDTIIHDGPPIATADQAKLAPRAEFRHESVAVESAPTQDGASGNGRFIALGLGLLIVISLVLGMLSNRTETISEATVPPVTAEAKPDPDLAMIERQKKDRRAREFLIDSLLRDAETATADYRLTTPVATSAFTYYQKVLELDPEHAEAIKGVDNIADTFYRLAKSAEKDWDYDKALRLANSGLSIRPEHPLLLALLLSLKADEGSTGRTLKNTFKGPKGWFN